MSDHSELKTAATRVVEVQTSQDVPISKLFDEFDALASPEAVLELIAEVEGLRAQHGRDSAELSSLCQARDDARKERDQLKSEVEQLRGTLCGVMDQVDGNIRATVRDCVNGMDDVQDIYEYCDNIEAIVDLAMRLGDQS